MEMSTQVSQDLSGKILEITLSPAKNFQLVAVLHIGYLYCLQLEQIDFCTIAVFGEYI